MAILHVCGCSNPKCTCEFVFTTNGTGLGKETYWKYHKAITRDIAAGEYGKELQLAMQSPDSVYLSTATEYSYCPKCNMMDFGGRILVYLHKEGKKVELVYDDWNGTYHLSGFNSNKFYREVLRLPTPCWRCGGELQFFGRYEDMKCPKCGSRMEDRESKWGR